MIWQGRLMERLRSSVQNLLRVSWNPCKPFSRCLEGIGGLVFPPFCAACGRLEQGGLTEDGLCSTCLAALKFIHGPLCNVCGSPFKSRSGENHICGNCILTPPPFSRAFTVFEYEGPVKALIKGIKFNDSGYALKTLSRLARRQIPESLFSPEFIVPVPLHTRRLRERGFNQSVRLARGIFPDSKILIDLLIKVKDTRPQTSLSSKERHMNLKGAFALGRPVPEAVTKVTIIDDVLTTGATIAECAKALHKGGVKTVDVFTAARAVSRA